MTMSSYQIQEQQIQKALKSLADTTGVAQSLVENILHYAKCLTINDSDEIDEPIFISQMIRQFNLTNCNMIIFIYRSLRHNTGALVKLLDFCKCICTFLSTNIHLKSDFVFKIYDQKGEGELSHNDIYKFVKANVILFDYDINEKDDDSTKELTELVMKTVNIDYTKTLNSIKFRQLVEHDNLIMNILGQVLPSSLNCMLFKDKISHLSTMEVRQMFKFERFYCLGGNKIAADSLCPIFLNLSKVPK